MSVDGRTDEDFSKAWRSLISTTKAEIEAAAKTRTQVIAIMNVYMDILSVDPSQLSVIHIAGTKGKGSTCALTESVLRAQGYTTGANHVSIP